MIEIQAGKIYKVGRARYRLVRIEGDKVHVRQLTYSLQGFTRMVQRAAAEKSSGSRKLRAGRS